MEMFFAQALRPFVALVLFTAAYLIARSLAAAMPSGRVKDVLFNREIQKRHPWKFALLGFLGIWGVILLVASLLV